LLDADFAGVAADLGEDGEGKGEGFASIFERDNRLGASAHGFDKSFDFGEKGFFGSDGRFCDLDLRIDARFSRAAHRKHEHILAPVVDRYVLPLLKKPQLAHAFGGDAAGGEIGHATGGEFDANIGDIDFAREDGQADGANFLYFGLHKGQDDVEVVNHEVEDDVDIERARAEDAEPMNLEEHGLAEQRQRGANRGIEALQVSDLRDALVLGGNLDEFVSLRKSGGDRLFDENVDAGFHQRARDVKMKDGRHSDRSRLHFTVRGEHLVDGAKGLAAEFARDGVGTRGIGIDDSDETHFAGLLQRVIEASVVASERADTDDGYIEQRKAPRKITGYCRRLREKVPLQKLEVRLQKWESRFLVGVTA